MKKALMVAVALVSFSSGIALAAPIDKGDKQDFKSELSAHQSIANALKALDAAIADMDKASDNYGGHKADALKESKAARKQLHKALWYRAKVDNAKDEKACEAALQASGEADLCKDL
jgi:hypothetical protein